MFTTSGIMQENNASVSLLILKKIYIDMEINLQTIYLNVSIFFSACFEKYFGIECVAKCAYPHYGQLCTPICNCTRGDCHHKYGCKSLLGIVILKHIMIQHTHIYRLVIYFYFFSFKSPIFYDRSLIPSLLKTQYGLFPF